VNIAGYWKPLTGATSTVVSLVRVPTLGTCPALATFQASLDGSETDSSAGRSGGGAVLICANGVGEYDPLLQINGQSTLEPNAVSPGDVVEARTTVSASSTTVTISNLSQHWTVSGTGAGGTPVDAGIGMIAGNCTGGSCSPVPAFSQSVVLGTINGRPLVGATRSNLTAANGSVEATASPAFLGLVFTVRYQSSCVPDPLTNRC
jgi:Peptidase A4 family